MSSSSSSLLCLTPGSIELNLLKESMDQLEKVTNSLEVLAADAPWSELRYFDAKQHNEIEYLFFRFLVSRRVLISLAQQQQQQTSSSSYANEYNKYKKIVDDAIGDVKAKIKTYSLGERILKEENSIKDPDNNTNEDDDDDDMYNTSRTSTIISLAAGFASLYYEGRLVKAFQNDKVAVDKLNETFYRSDIERDTFRQIRLDCTDTTRNGRLEHLENAYKCYCDSDIGDDTIRDDDDDDQANQEIVDLLPVLYGKIQKITQELVGTSPFHLSALENKLKQTKIAKKAHIAKTKTRDAMEDIRAHTFKGVSRLKSPTSYLIRFSEEQKSDVFSRIKSGDLVFTYTAGYMSSVFIPGQFKHGITYVGSPKDRADVGLNGENVSRHKDSLPEGETTKLLEQFQVATSSLDGELNGDVIEAVAEGVIFNNLEHIMDTHVNRLLVLRPSISSEERTSALIDIFRYLGAKYDFGFDFADSSAVVCTEIIYHAFNGKGEINFELVDHTGHLSLSADDIVDYYLSHRTSFDFVLLALEDLESTEHDACIFTGNEGISALETLMESE
ncbi:hypothetical protein FRACYDRAFT_232300 [Fragilariopsis cylindrus CCMP1102]|uniref:Uncharacterized protein n=1 Tax=Fragilariopsis cylindrus CCMP1102 TaxID=635003 RepID=A0A1E7FVJ5_9STRA|nr:hypothetical protein FRACYDRAFT_232300 [Fragilariopsis cylindrus CCMP1102]|eukprot:OEU22147.1 hypothetical protein FRACYDRAFT_232300 [Fragilariopsis cylindrus CCMP1102]